MQFEMKTVLRQARALAMRGQKFYCPICEGRFRAFLSHGDPPRSNARCPKCGSLERHRVLWLVLERLWWPSNPPGSDKRLLHVAPERSFSGKLAGMYDYLSVDLDGSRAMRAMDITQIPEPDESFDVVVCNHVLEHIPDDAAAIAEIFRVLKHGGWASLQVPMKGAFTEEGGELMEPSERARRFGQDDHVRQYGEDFSARLLAAGFVIRRFSRADGLLHRLLPEVDPNGVEQHIWLCIKP